MTGYDEPATGRQLHTIACLCLARGIKELVEDRHMTIGEAGQFIRRLMREHRDRQVRVRSRNPNN